MKAITDPKQIAKLYGSHAQRGEGTNEVYCTGARLAANFPKKERSYDELLAAAEKRSREERAAEANKPIESEVIELSAF